MMGIFTSDELFHIKIALIEYVKKERQELWEIDYILTKEERDKKEEGISLANDALEKIEIELLT